MIQAILQEITLKLKRIDFVVDTIYFGGGTPSLLSEKDLARILEKIYAASTINSDPEITIEVNPDDVTQRKFSQIFKLGFNRISLGVQSFNPANLIYTNRIHTPEQAHHAIEVLVDLGFKNISCDLIYAIPSSVDYLTNDLERIVSLNIPHVSLYGLTIEDKTVFGNWLKKGQIEEVSEEQASKQYLYVVSMLKENGYRHYEISNLGKPGYESKHNHSYWRQQPYIGVGPGAHSYDGKATRTSNIRNNAGYIRSINNWIIPEEVEHLTPMQQVNEFILTRLRTAEGIDNTLLLDFFNVDLLSTRAKEIKSIVSSGLAYVNDEKISLTTLGFLVADEIALKLFYDE